MVLSSLLHSLYVQAMTEEIETNFPQGHFSWDDRKPSDVASILKQYLR